MVVPVPAIKTARCGSVIGRYVLCGIAVDASHGIGEF